MIFHSCLFMLLFFFHSATSHIQSYQLHDVSVGGQCALNVSCTVHNRTVATGCVFMYDSNGDGTLDDETLIGLPTRGNTAEHHLIIDCNLNLLNFTISAVAGTTLSTVMPLDCPISSPFFNHVSNRGKQGFCVCASGIVTPRHAQECAQATFHIKI